MNREEYLEALLTLPRLYKPLVSLDGRWVAWTQFGTGHASDVFFAPTDSSAPPTRLTSTPDRSVAVSWTPGSTAVLVQQDHDGDERVQLFRVEIAKPGVIQPLTEPHPEYFLRGGQLHSNDRWLVYGANFEAANKQEIEATWVYRHDLETGERVPLARPQQPAYIEPQMNQQGTHILYTRKDLHPSGEQVWMVDIEGNEDREILNFGPQSKVYASWFPDGHRVLVLSETDTYRRVGVWDRDNALLEWVLNDPERNIEMVYAPHGSNRIVVVDVRDACTMASLLNLHTGDETPLEVRGTLVPIAPVSPDEWVGQYYSSQQPGNLVRFSLDNLDPGRFVSLNRVWDQTPLTASDLAPADDFRWKSVDGMEIQGWLYRAYGGKQSARGTIVYVHGGPTAHSEDNLNPQIQFYASQGFNVLDPNYRGSTGFSQAFREAIKEDGWGGREQDDIRTGIEALITAGIAEPGKIGITGTSYGGYSAWCAITRMPPDLIAASAPVCGMTDLVVDYQTTRPDLRPYTVEMLGGRPNEVPERYRERSPINFVNNIKGRLLIVQGLQDPNVTPQNVRSVQIALDKAGVKYSLMVFEDEGHGILRPKNRRVLYTRLLNFFGEAFAQASLRKG